jgi:ParB-like chromosome segregation protein Spo0J
VRPRDDGYELVHGERRLRAHEKLGEETIEAEIREMGDKEALEASIVENLQREDVNPIEEAEGIDSLIEEFDLTQAEAAEKLGKSRSHISNQLGLLNLPDELQRYVLCKTLTPWEARTLNSVWGEYWLLDLTFDHGLSVSELREIIDELKNGATFATVLRKRPITAFEDSLASTEELAKKQDLDEEERKQLEDSETTHYRLWANENIDGFDVQLPDYDEKIDTTPKPVTYDVLSQKVVSGYRRIKLALDHHDYDGDIRVEFHHHRSIFEWDKRVPDKSQKTEA